MRRILNMIRNISNWQAYLKYKYGGRKAKDFLFKCRNGFEIRVPERLLHTFKECFFGEDYLKGFSAGFRKSDVNVVIDVGANVGYFSLFILSKFPDAQVYAYEPLPKNFNLLKTYKESLSLSNLNIQNSAVNHSAKDIVLHYDASDSYSTGASIFENETGEATQPCEMNNRPDLPSQPRGIIPPAARSFPVSRNEADGLLEAESNNSSISIPLPPGGRGPRNSWPRVIQ
ncbi:MAG: FkbM family methyltransferase [Bacteroidetes bacterium]|nr:FkbM family methyltransferase [Bacteroidota bacterium]